MPKINTISFAITGASGLRYALRLIECLLEAEKTLWVTYSSAAQIVAQSEITPPIANLANYLREYSAQLSGKLHLFDEYDWFSPAASGSNAADAMLVCPCSMGTLAAIAAGLSNNLIERAADVCIKEGRKLILVVRETPFSAIHLENMLKLARLGVVILPANPGFYNQPQKIEELIDFVVARVLDQLNISQSLIPPWGKSDVR